MDIWIFNGSFKFRRNFVELSLKFRRNFVECVFNFLKFRQHFVEISSKCPVSGASVSELPAALRRPQKKHAPGILEHVSCVFCRCLLIFDDFAGFRVSQPCASVWWLPAALRRPQKKHAPGILEYVSCGFQQIRRRINENSTKSYK